MFNFISYSRKWLKICLPRIKKKKVNFSHKFSERIKSQAKMKTFNFIPYSRKWLKVCLT